MSDMSRRDVLRRIALAVASVGVVDRVSAQEVHHLASQATTASGGWYAPTALSEHEYKTVERLTDLIIPVENGAPGALAAGAPAWIDMLAGANDQLKRIYTTGLAWMDDACPQRGAADFLSASPRSRPHSSIRSLIDVTRRRSWRRESCSSPGSAG